MYVQFPDNFESSSISADPQWVLGRLPQNEQEVPNDFINLFPQQLSKEVQINSVEVPPISDAVNGINLFAPVLEKLDSLKDRLGGSPVFHSRTPTINEKDQNTLYFGLPLSAIKDWFRMILKKEWKPQIFWETVAKQFGVTKNNQKSQYEEAHIRIQQFGLLLSNKERFFEILDFQQKDRYSELCTITGLAWHPYSNGVGTEKTYIEFIERFLTDFFESAKRQGDDALVEYFNAFSGVCFEDRAIILEAYALTHPIDPQSDVPLVLPADWDTGSPVELAYMKEAEVLATQLHDAPTPKQLFEHLTKKGVFDLEFLNSEEIRIKPTKEEFDKWAQKQVELYILSDLDQ